MSHGEPVKPWIKRHAPALPGSSKDEVLAGSSGGVASQALAPLATRSIAAVCRRSMSDPKLPETALQIHIDETMADGVYVNMALVNHTDTEFTLDCIYVQPQQPKAKVRARIITSPRHMKRLVAAMVDNLQKYEAKFGVIDAGDSKLPVH
jgi:GMP synthase PP-ATPase subunit